MNTSFHSCVAVLCGLFFSAITYSQSIVQTSAPSEEWPIAIQREHKPGVIWWIPGSALTNRDTSYNLEQLSEAGFGGMSMVPIYGVHGAEDRFLEHLSPEWNREFAFVLREANRLGLWLDLTPGTGWKIGGPTVELDMGEQSIRLANGQLESRFNRAKVKRAAPGGAGLSIDPYSIHALNKFLSSFYERLTLPAGLAPRAYYHDSFEYGGNWTSELPYVFQRQHGYDLRNNAAELFNQGLDPERNARVQFDYRETLDSLHYQFVEALRSAAHEHGSQLREQAHGSPANILDLYALADIPETEVFGANRFGVRGLRREEGFVRRENDHAPLVNRLASSAAHIGGGKLVSSESFTWLREHFNTALSDIKPEIDSLFVTGVNHIFYHGNCYSPQDGQWPGWLFYASTEVNSRNAFWRDISVLNTYIARCQSILQSGEADNDVLLYWPLADVYQQATREPHIFLRVHNHEQWLTATACGELADHFSHTGVQFDFVSDRFLQNIQIVDGKLVLGNSIYKAIVVPPCQYMSTDSLARLSDLATAGAVVCFCAPGPSDVPGLGHLETRRREFQAVKLKLETDGLASSVDVEHVGQWLAQHGIENESLVGSGLQLIRRRVDQGVYYFVTNLSDQDFSSWAVVSRPFVEALRLDPMLGRIGRIENRPSQKEVFLQLASGESTILFLSNQQRNEVGEWVTWEADGREISIEGPWQVEFIAGGPNLPSNFETEELGSWTSSSASAESFAGTARYRCTFELTDACWASKLKLGDVRETARVFLDETLVQTLVANPFECQIPNLSAGKHSLEIEVTNLSANRIRDLDLRKIEWKKFYDINYVNLDYKPFDASAWPIRPSGLLGPVTLQPLRAAHSVIDQCAPLGDRSISAWQVTDFRTHAGKMLDNFLAVATSIIVFALFQVANTPMPRGDRSVGYSFLLILLCLLFVICSGLLAVTLAWHKRFGGPHSNIVWQNTAIASGWLALSLATLAGVAFLVEWHAGDFPVTLRWLSQTQVFVWLPALFLFPVFWQVNFGRPDQSLPPLMRLLTGAGFLISIGMCCMLLWGWWHMTVQRHSEMANRIFERNEKRFNENLQFIAEQPDDGPLVNLLSLAGKFQEREVRDAAVAKIKTNPDWEQELIQLLTNSSFQSEVYDFMDGNLVDHPNDFVGPMKTSLKRTAEAIQLEISNSSHLQPWSMEHFGIERCLRAIDQQFVHLPKAEFREEVQAIQRALQRSDTAKVPRFSTLIAVDTWLQVHP